MQFLIRMTMVTALALGVAGCSAGAVHRIARLQAGDGAEARESMHAAIDKASRESAAETPFWLPARLNRAGCDCPPWEVQVWGSWRRVSLEWGTTPLPAAARDESAADGTRLWLQLEESDGPMLRDDGRQFPRFEVLATRPFEGAP